MTYHIYDLIQSDTKHYCHVVLNRKDGSAGLAVSKQVLSQFLVVIAILNGVTDVWHHPATYY